MSRPALAALMAALTVTPAAGQTVAEAPRAELRWLDKLSGETADLTVVRGQAVTQGRLTIQLDSCRYPADNPAGEAYAHLSIRDNVSASMVFSGWMVGSSPALSALDHARYDVWVLRCLTE